MSDKVNTGSMKLPVLHRSSSVSLVNKNNSSVLSHNKPVRKGYPKRPVSVTTRSGVSAIIIVLYVLSLISAVFLCLVTVTSGLCSIKTPAVVSSVSVFLLQLTIPAAIYDGIQFSVLALIADVAGFVIALIGFLMILNSMHYACTADSYAEECKNSTGTLTPYTWAAIWAGSLIVAFALLFILTCVKIYYTNKIKKEAEYSKRPVF